MNARRKALVVVVAVVVLSAGCLAAGPAESDPGGGEPSPTPQTTAVPTEDGHAAAMNEPDPDKSVRVENHRNHSVTVQVRVVREATNETVYDEHLTVAAGADRVVYTVSRADPEGVERFTVTVRAAGATERVGLETSQCYGDVFAELQADGSLYLYYAIC